MDPLGGSRSLYTPPKIEVRSGGAFGHGIGGGRRLGKLPVLYAICGSRGGVIGNGLLIF